MSNLSSKRVVAASDSSFLMLMSMFFVYGHRIAFLGRLPHGAVRGLSEGVFVHINKIRIASPVVVDQWFSSRVGPHPALLTRIAVVLGCEHVHDATALDPEYRRECPVAKQRSTSFAPTGKGQVPRRYHQQAMGDVHHRARPAGVENGRIGSAIPLRVAFGVRSVDVRVGARIRVVRQQMERGRVRFQREVRRVVERAAVVGDELLVDETIYLVGSS